ncbi:Nonribosomal peptide synthetase 14 [Penicillium rolfsii]|nr:Nonribosomal peptide synthetase 14 [Penicillium rolfsii]
MLGWTGRKRWAGLIDGISALIPSSAYSVKAAPRTGGRRVVLTGCTGFLGTHMLRNLVADPTVAELHCLCTRSRHARVQDAKIREYKGDLTKPLLGLFNDDFIHLARTADLIIHLGAEVNHLKSYEAVRMANVVSTQILLAMTTPRGVPVHSVSSSSVFMLLKDTNVGRKMFCQLLSFLFSLSLQSGVDLLDVRYPSIANTTPMPGEPHRDASQPYFFKLQSILARVRYSSTESATLSPDLSLRTKYHVDSRRYSGTI